MYSGKRNLVMGDEKLASMHKFFFTPLYWKKDEVIPDDLPSKVDPAGYVDPNVKIREAQKAGIRIDEWNRAIYDYENNNEFDEDDDRYINEDIYRDENELLSEGYHSLEIYRKKMRILYGEYLKSKDSAETLPESSVVPSEPSEKASE